MSRLYFHSPTATAELAGSEKMWLERIGYGPAVAAWDLHTPGAFDRAAEVIAMVPEPPAGRHGANYLHHDLREAQVSGLYEKARQLVTALQTALRATGLDMYVAGHHLRTANLEANTALVAGSEPVALAAKLGQWGEQHAWVEGPDRAWLADIIQQGLDAAIFRRGIWCATQPGGPRDRWADQGWDGVLALLRAGDDQPVVTSYSVCDSFPNPGIAGGDQIVDEGWMPDWAATDNGRADWDEMDDDVKTSYRREHAQELWYEQPDEQRWQQAMDGLRQERPWARLAPDTLTEVTFGPPVTVFDLFAADRDERVRAACQPEGGMPA